MILMNDKKDDTAAATMRVLGILFVLGLAIASLLFLIGPILR
jgi:hypothetical protein